MRQCYDARMFRETGGVRFRCRRVLFLACLGIGNWLLYSGPLPVRAAQSGSQAVPASEDVTRGFQTALSLYRSGRYTEAQHQLQPLLETNPSNFEINELTGLILAATGDDEKAASFLSQAVRIKPDLPEGRTALAASLVRLHRMGEAEIQLRQAVALAPQSYDTNHNLGELYIQLDRLHEALPCLKRAHEIDPADYNNGYDLSLAYERTGDLDHARQQLNALIRIRDKAELHSLLGEVEEQAKNYMQSAAELETAAHMDPSEDNIFEWGTELLLHQTFEPALAVFQAGLARYPRSARLETGFGVAQYGLGHFEAGAQAFLDASDMNPADSRPLVFLGKAYDNLSPATEQQIVSRYKRLINSGRAEASIRYYYAMALWRQGADRPNPGQQALIESLLKAAVALDSRFSDARLQLGILFADQHKYEDAIAQYELALKIDPSVALLHYRLGQALARSGATARAQEEFAVFERLRTQQTEAADKRTAEIQQFVYTLRHSHNANHE